MINGHLNQLSVDKKTGIVKYNQNWEFQKNQLIKLFKIEGLNLKGVIISGKK